MSRPITAIIKTSSLESNLDIIRSHAPNKKIWSVVKANAYGHRLHAVWKGLKKTDGFALLNLHEAIFLRKNGWKGAILLLEGFFNPKELTIIAYYNLTITIHSKWQIQAIKRATLKFPLNIYVKFNSGMNRFGFNEKIILNVLEELNSLKQISTLALMTHFSDSNNIEKIKEQMKKINNVIQYFPCTQCYANSSAILWHPKTHGTWIRPGIILYGASPNGNWKDISRNGFQPVMTLQSKLIAIQKISAQEYIGYKGTYKTEKKRRIGIIACGYADGYPRNAPTGTPVWIHNTKSRILGKVCMDTITIDLQHCPYAKIGSNVELWGKNIKVDEIATLSGTLSYELLSKLSQKIKMKIQ
ncbi:MAG: alanine racemase 2 [Candidatus Westeberhardia cardiocondylae]|nr:alanine racemase 2 [Candidatus Westeberhardia cardiocondylae]